MRGGSPSAWAALLTLVALFALTGYQVTTETAGSRLLGRLGAALIEIDRWLPAHREDLDLLARDKPQSTVELKDVPIDVSLPAALLIDADEPTLRRVITDAMGAELYRKGNDAFRGDEGEEGTLGLAEPVRWTVGLLSSGIHGFWKLALPAAALALFAVAAAAMTGGRSPLASLIVGAGVGAVLSFGAWLAAELGRGLVASPVDKEITLILRDGAWIGLRDSLAVALIGVTLVFLLSMVARPAAGATDDWPAAETPPDASSA